MTGVDRATGKTLSGVDHLKQSILDILTTPVGSRVMRRAYGSTLFRLVDRPVDKGFLIDLYAATADALARWEPRLSVDQVQATMREAGAIELQLTGRYLPSGKPAALTVTL